MNGYVLKRVEDGRYVAKRGSEHSYTRNIENAQVYPTRDAARADSCGNEYSVSLASIFEVTP